jgi:hypothetical protein
MWGFQDSETQRIGIAIALLYSEVPDRISAGHRISWHRGSVLFLRPLKYIPRQYLHFATLISKSFPIHLQPTIHTLTADRAVQKHNLRGTYCFHDQGTNFSRYRGTGAVDRTTKYIKLLKNLFRINNIVNGLINFIASIKPVHASVAWTIIRWFVNK